MTNPEIAAAVTAALVEIEEEKHITPGQRLERGYAERDEFVRKAGPLTTLEKGAVRKSLNNPGGVR